jgi:hypothetical protein
MDSTFSLLGGGIYQARTSGKHTTVDVHIVLRHPAGRETLFENVTATFPAEFSNLADGVNRLLDRFHYVARNAVVDHFGNGTLSIRDHWGAAGHCLDHRQSEWLRPINGEEQSQGAAEESALLRFSNLAQEFDGGIAQHRFDPGFEKLPVFITNLGGDFERDACAAGDLNRVVESLFRRHPPNKCQVLT